MLELPATWSTASTTSPWRRPGRPISVQAWVPRRFASTISVTPHPSPFRRSPASNTPPPPAPVPGAGATRPPPFSRNFEVYFATNSAVLNRDAKATVDQAAAAAKDNAPTHIAVGGHTDTTGSQAYNQKLSERRADAVRKELIAQGVSSDDITTTGYGENEL